MNRSEPDIRPILAALQGSDLERDDFAESQIGSSRMRERSIKTIVRKGMGRRPGLIWTLVAMVRSLGLRNLLFGLWDCVFIGLILTVAVWATVFGSFMKTAWPSRVDRIFGLVVPIFVCSPALFLVVHLLVVLKERNLNTLNLIRTCRWSFRQIAAVRMLLFGMVSMMISSLATVLLARTTNPGLSTMTLLGISFSSLFLFSLAQIWVEEHMHGELSICLVLGLWIVLGMMLYLTRFATAPILVSIPPALSLATGLVLLTIFLLVLHGRCVGSPLPRWVWHMKRLATA